MLWDAFTRSGLTRTSVAAKAGVGLTAVSETLNRQRPISIGFAYLVGRALGIEPRALLRAQLDDKIAAYERTIR